MDFLFGSSFPLAARFFIAFLVVLALIGLTAWLVRRFGANRLGGVARGRQPRLAVIDAASVDGRRRLVLIRRDNTEHLLMIGGPTDVVVETNIVRASGTTGVREPARVSMSTETTARLTSAEGSWPQSVAEPSAPIAPPRRSTATEEPWLPPEPTAPRARQVPADSLTGLAAELSSKFGAPEIAATREPMLREPMPRTTAAPAVAPSLPETPPSPQSDRNLAEMAQQLEAALRRAPTQDSRPPVTDPLAVSLTAKVSPRAPARDVKPRQEPKFEPKFESKFDAKFESKFEPKREPKFEKAEPKFEPKFEAKPEAPTAPDKNIYDNLEEEMASLLGRPPEKP
jgi:flagellar biogenesis protein FliO